MHQTSTLHVSYLNEAGLKGKNVGVEDSKCLWGSLPRNLPIWSCSPTIPIDEKRVVCVTKQELACHALDMYWLDVLLAHDEIERCICLVEQRLCLECLEANNLEAAGAANTELGPQEVY
jgi:hypothetical protein